MRVLQYGQPTRHHVFVWVIGLTAFRYSPFIPQLGHSSVVSNTSTYLFAHAIQCPLHGQGVHELRVEAEPFDLLRAPMC